MSPPEIPLPARQSFRHAGPAPIPPFVRSKLSFTQLFVLRCLQLSWQRLGSSGATDTNRPHRSVVDRCRDRERKLNWIERWRFDVVMRSAILTIQGSLGLLGSALARYLWEVDRMVSSVVIGFTAFGLLLYVIMVTVSVFSVDCPFQTPLSLLIRSIINTVESR